MKHLVTGGSGFLGNLIAQRLLRQGEKVRILDIWDDPQRSPAIEFIQCSICDRERVIEAMRGMDIVHHNAALVPLTKSGSQFWNVNVEGSRIAADAAAEVGVKAFIHMSSSAIFGVPSCLPITRDTKPSPVEIYGRAKLAGEEAVREVCTRNGIPLIIIRPRTILGQGRLGIFQVLFDWISNGNPVFLSGDGNNLFQFVHAHDLMDAYMLALEHMKVGTYNVGTDRFCTLRQTLEHLISYANSRSKLRSVPPPLVITGMKLLDRMHLVPLAPWHYLTYHKPFYFDVEHVLELGWRPKYSNNEMFQEAFDWHRSSQQTRDTLEGSPHRKRVAEGALRLLRRLN